MQMEHCIWQVIAAGMWYKICAHFSASIEKFDADVVVHVCILELPDSNLDRMASYPYL
jgi:hypothetical protein